MHHRNPKRAAGFTLVELLVVIGIIAVLISILLPALSRARQHAVNVQCMSNMRQMGLILNMYANDNKDYPYYVYPGWPPGGWDRNARVSDWYGGRWWSATALRGDVMRIAMYPMLKAGGYMGTYEVGFCPTLWGTRTFQYVNYGHPAYRVGDCGAGSWVDLTGQQLDQAVPMSGDPNERPGLGFCSNGFTPWTIQEYMKYNAGEYLYLGNGTMQNEQVLTGMLPTQMVDQYGAPEFYNADGQTLPSWSGVHANGPTGMSAYDRKVTRWFSGRVPLMSEGVVGGPGGSSQVTAPHFSTGRFRNVGDRDTNVGKGNVLFSDGSVESFSFGH